MGGKKKKAPEAAQSRAREGGWIFEVLDALGEPDSDARDVVSSLRSGADLSMSENALSAITAALDAQTESFDEDALDTITASVNEVQDSRYLQDHDKLGFLCVLLYGLQHSRPTIAFRASLAYITILKKLQANASCLTNVFVVRRILGSIAKFLTHYGESHDGDDTKMTQESIGGTQQSLVLTPDVPASQISQVPASQRPRKRTGSAASRKADIPSDWQDCYKVACSIISCFNDDVVIRSLDNDLQVSLFESICQLPSRELTGVFVSAGLVSVPSELTRICYSVVKRALVLNPSLEVYDSDQHAQQDEEGVHEAPGSTTIAAQDFILPLLIPFLHCAPVYTHQHVRLADAQRLQEATVIVLKEASLPEGKLHLFFKHFVVNAERRPRSDPLEIACRAGVRLFEMMGDPTPVILHLFEATHSERVFHRLFAVETIYSLLRDGHALSRLPGTRVAEFIDIIFCSVNDTASVVRSKALANLSQVMQAIGDTACPLREPISQYLLTAKKTPLPPSLIPPSGGGIDGQLPPPSTPGNASSVCGSHVSYSPGMAVVPLTMMDWLIASVVARTREEKALVRKAAIDLLLQFFQHAVVEADSMINTVLELLDPRLEPSLLVRRQAVMCASAIIERSPHIALQSKLLGEGILFYYTFENEEQVLRAMLHVVQLLIFSPLQKVEDTPLTEPQVWELLSSLAESQLHVLGKMCCKMLESNEVDASIVSSLLSRIDAVPDKCADAWYMLPIVARQFHKHINTAVIMKCFRTLSPSLITSNRVQHGIMQNVLKLLATLKISDDHRAEVVSTLEKYILSLQCHPNLVMAAARCYAALTEGKVVQRVARAFIALCTAMLYNLLSQENTKPLPKIVVDMGLDKVSLSELPVALATLSAMLQPSVISSAIPPSDLDQLSQMVNAVCNTAPFTDTSKQDLPFSSADIPEPVLRYAFLCEARLCLLHKSSCKKGVPLLLRGLSCTEVSIRTTCVNSLADISVKYPGTVDRFLPNLSTLLSDHDVRVRLTAATIITQLLGESFVKLRPFMVFELLVLVTDPSESVAAFARFSLLKVLIPKEPYLLINNFVECLFVFNNYPFHPKFNKLATQITRLCGESYRASRIQLLRFVASQIQTEKDILRIYEQLHEVLEMCTAEGHEGVKLHLGCPEGVSVFKDTIHLLMTPELNLTSRTPAGAKDAKGQQQGVDEEDEEAQSNLRKQLWQAAVKTKVHDTVCPILSSVALRLREIRSPLQQDLIQYAAYTTQEYEKDLKEMVPDEVLARDIQLVFEESRRMRKNRGGALINPETLPPPSTPKASTPGRGSVGSRTPSVRLSRGRPTCGTPVVKTPVRAP